MAAVSQDGDPALTPREDRRGGAQHHARDEPGAQTLAQFHVALVPQMVLIERAEIDEGEQIGDEEEGRRSAQQA